LSHEAALVDALSRRSVTTFKGDVFRATIPGYDPLAASTRGGRWSTHGGPSVLYTSLEPAGALAEIVFHWSQLTPIPKRPVALHTLAVETARTLRLIRADLASLGVEEAHYETINYERTQQIGAAVAFLGCDGLLAPNARWTCENLMIYMDNVSLDRVFGVTDSRSIDWTEWAKQNGRLPPEAPN
jgi:RES domain-containing protein